MNTTFLVGNGIIEGGWEPVKRAIKETFGSCPEQDPNFAFANLIYQLRWLHYHASDRSNESQDTLEARLSKYKELKNNISNEIRKATDSDLMKVRPEFKRSLDRFARGDTRIATTNWDRLLERYVDSCVGHPVYIHGNVKHPDSLYLPTETIEEPYRDKPDSGLHASLAGGLMSVLQTTDRLVVYGLSLSPLDVELGLLIVGGFHETSLPAEVIVIDPNHALVTERLHYLGISTIPNFYEPNSI